MKASIHFTALILYLKELLLSLLNIIRVLNNFFHFSFIFRLQYHWYNYEMKYKK